jgi:hypothetical protein
MSIRSLVAAFALVASTAAAIDRAPLTPEAKRLFGLTQTAFASIDLDFDRLREHGVLPANPNEPSALSDILMASVLSTLANPPDQERAGELARQAIYMAYLNRWEGASPISRGALYYPPSEDSSWTTIVQNPVWLIAVRAGQPEAQTVFDGLSALARAQRASKQPEGLDKNCVAINATIPQFCGKAGPGFVIFATRAYLDSLSAQQAPPDETAPALVRIRYNSAAQDHATARIDWQDGLRLTGRWETPSEQQTSAAKTMIQTAISTLDESRRRNDIHGHRDLGRTGWRVRDGRRRQLRAVAGNRIQGGHEQAEETCPEQGGSYAPR